MSKYLKIIFLLDLTLLSKHQTYDGDVYWYLNFIWELMQMRLLREFGSVVKYFGPVFQRSNNKCCGHCTDLHPMHHQAFFDGEMVYQKRHCAFYLFLFMWQCSLYLQCSLFEQHTKLGAFWRNVLLNLTELKFRCWKLNMDRKWFVLRSG